MLNGLWKLTWIETKVFLREPMGVFGTIGIPVVLFIVLGRVLGAGSSNAADGASVQVPILAALMIAISAVLSLVAIISIYREGGILKRLRATPLTPVTILSAQVIVKLGFTAISLVLLVLAGRQFFPGAITPHLASFSAALLLSTLSILSLGFVIASLVPTARFAQPIGAGFMYPMLAVSGLFFPLEGMSPVLKGFALLLPTTHAVALLEATWRFGDWAGQWIHVAALLLAFGVCTAISTKVFRWE
ncbi:MAG: ABC transporter permease [Rhodothermales bacterium]|nr:ABC transporter permease [Rhodothermales bacterium]